MFQLNCQNQNKLAADNMHYMCFIFNQKNTQQFSSQSTFSISQVKNSTKLQYLKVQCMN